MAHEPCAIRGWSEISALGARKNVCKDGSFLVIFSIKAYMRVKILLRKLERTFPLAVFHNFSLV